MNFTVYDRDSLIFVKDGIHWMIRICEKIVLTHEKGGLMEYAEW